MEVDEDQVETAQEQKILEDRKNGNSSGSGSSNRQISRKFTFTVCLLLILTMCVFWLISNYNTQNILRQQADSLGQSLAQQTASQLTELMLANDLISMNVILANLTRDSAIREVYVVNIDNELIASALNRETEPAIIISLPISLKNLQVEYSAPITIADSIAGYVRLKLDLSYIEAGILNNFILIAGTTLLMLIVSIAVTTTYFKYLVSFPANLLSYYLSKIREGEIETCPEPSNNDELSLAIRQFNYTAEFLAQNTFLTNIGVREPETKNENYKSISGEQDTTILSISMSNFQYLASTVSEENRMKLLTKYYFYTGKISQLYNGTVCHCSDDEVLVNFGNTQFPEEQPFYAICAAQLFLQLVDNINDTLKNAGTAKFRLTAHSGRALGSLYSPITQSTDILTGKTLDFVRMISKECPENSLLISEPAFEHAGAGTRVDADEFGPVGEEQINTYIARDPMSDYRILLKKQAAQLINLYNG